MMVTFIRYSSTEDSCRMADVLEKSGDRTFISHRNHLPNYPVRYASVVSFTPIPNAIDAQSADRLVSGGQSLRIAHWESEGVAPLDLRNTALLGGVLSRGLSWAPFGGIARGCLLHHLIDLLERQTLGLGNQEVRVDERESAESSPDEEN